MECPYCHEKFTEVANSRPTKKSTQVWRRRRCLNCGTDFTTHEIIDLSHLLVLKKSGKIERFSRIKLYSGIYGATISSKTPNRELVVDKITREIERQILFLKQKTLTSTEIANITLNTLRQLHTRTFLRYLAYCKDIENEAQMKKELQKYLSPSSPQQSSRKSDEEIKA